MNKAAKQHDPILHLYARRARFSVEANLNKGWNKPSSMNPSHPRVDFISKVAKSNKNIIGRNQVTRQREEKTAGSVKLNIAANYYLSSSLSNRTTLTFSSIMIFASARLPYFSRGRLKHSFTNVDILQSGLITELFGQGLMIRDFL